MLDYNIYLDTVYTFVLEPQILDIYYLTEEEEILEQLTEILTQGFIWTIVLICLFSLEDRDNIIKRFIKAIKNRVIKDKPPTDGDI